MENSTEEQLTKIRSKISNQEASLISSISNIKHALNDLVDEASETLKDPLSLLTSRLKMPAILKEKPLKCTIAAACAGALFGLFTRGNRTRAPGMSHSEPEIENTPLIKAKIRSELEKTANVVTSALFELARTHLITKLRMSQVDLEKQAKENVC